MQVGDTVRSLPGFERTIMPGYEGELIAKDGSSITVQVRFMPDQGGAGHVGRFELPPQTDMKLHSLDFKWEVVE